MNQRFITKISFLSECPMYGDNKATIDITENVVLHKRTKHIEVDRHIVRKKLRKKSLW